MEKLVFIAAAVNFFTTFKLISAANQILEQPQNQYILEGTSATIRCIARGNTAYWTISGETLTTTHQNVVSRYEAMGVMFFNNYSPSNPEPGTHNLTMIVPACLSTLVTNIQCTVTDSHGGNKVESDIINIIVFSTLRPHPPNLTVDVTYYPSTLPFVSIEITGKPLWPNYEITEYRVNITNGSDGSLLDRITVPNNSTSSSNTVTVHVNQSLFESTTEHCYSLKISASAVSSQYDMGEPYQIQEVMFRTPGMFSDQAVNHTVLFNPDGTLSLINVQIQLPDVCSYQLVNYSLMIKDIGDKANEVAWNGSYNHRGPGVVSQYIRGLRKNSRYLAQVQVDSETGSSKSNQLNFGTTADFDVCPSNGTTADFDVCSSNGNVSSFKITMGITIPIGILLILTTFSVVFATIYILSQRKRLRVHGQCSTSSTAYNSMVSNPIYAGPVYETVQPPPQPQYSSLDRNGECSADNESSQVTGTSHSSSNHYISQYEAPKKNGKEQNKLHLTLPCTSPVKDGSQQGLGSVQDTYVEMSMTVMQTRSDTLV